ncbi:MAG: alpha/beta hydrolase [Spirochaetales bacterium]|uniref:Alpha/beta hydrolase n=1 Tax=Candidatus Thalassospirochaeta sargassi TaxID=3119039 RepID=A0AAJ1IHR4_9SPIO|nr:alpha/beta hydrolase [Spirochaetales bacterium]
MPIVLFILIISACKTTSDLENLLPPSALADSDSKFIEIDGITVHYKETGDGNPEILMLHGLMANTGVWDYIVPQLSSNYRCIAYDRPAFGLTERPEVTEENNPYSPEKAETQTLEFISKLQMKNPVLLGHSAGGNLALRLAIKYPEKFSSLILISPGIYTEIPPPLIRQLMELGLFKKMSIEVIRSFPNQIDRLLAGNYFNPELITSEMKENYLQPSLLENWDQALWEYLIAQDDSIIAERLKEIELPVLIIQGREDEVVPPSDNKKAAGILPNAELLFLENCGHVAHEEQPDAVAAAVKAFISRP